MTVHEGLNPLEELLDSRLQGDISESSRLWSTPLSGASLSMLQDSPTETHGAWRDGYTEPHRAWSFGSNEPLCGGCRRERDPFSLCHNLSQQQMGSARVLSQALCIRALSRVQILPAWTRILGTLSDPATHQCPHCPSQLSWAGATTSPGP